MIIKFLKNIFSSSNSSQTKEGTVKFFNTKKGYGFISVNGSEDEIFVHSSNLIDKIRQKDKVTFDIDKSDKGFIAVKVRLLK